MQRYLLDLYRRKDLLLYLILSGLKAQHRNSFLGYFWWLLDPLLGVMVYYFVVIIVFARGGPDYGAYLVIGMVVWRWLNVTVSSASRSIISQGGIITQVYLPKVIFPLGAACTQLLNFTFGLVVIAAFLLFSRIIPGIELLWLPALMLVQLLFLVAISMLLAFSCVFIQDIDTVTAHFTRLWFFGSPVIWRPEMIPAELGWLVEFNPMAHLLFAYRDIFMYRTAPDFAPLAIIALLSLLLILLLLAVYSRHEHRIIKAL